MNLYSNDAYEAFVIVAFIAFEVQKLVNYHAVQPQNERVLGCPKHHFCQKHVKKVSNETILVSGDDVLQSHVDKEKVGDLFRIVN
jgi:hypothetical protein